MCGLIVVLISGSCYRNDYDSPISEAISSQEPISQTLTLSGNQLKLLDWDGGNPKGAKVVSKRLISGSGIEFDIHFPSNGPGDNTIDYVSSGVGGKGTLVGFEIRDYKLYSLNFTLVSIDGATGSDLSQELIVGALIGPTANGKLSGYTPVTLSFASGGATAVSSIPVSGVRKIYQIGFHVHFAKAENWNPSGSTVTIRVEPVENTPAPPWPYYFNLYAD